MLNRRKKEEENQGNMKTKGDRKDKERLGKRRNGERRKESATSAEAVENEANTGIGQWCHHGDDMRPIRGHEFPSTNPSLILGLWMGSLTLPTSLSRYYEFWERYLDLKRILPYAQSIHILLFKAH